MDINILSLLEVDIHEFSGSVMERGENAGAETWENSVEQARETPLLKTPEEIENTKEWILDFGAWTEEEVSEWSDETVNAWLVQYVAGSLREMEGCSSIEEYEKEAERGKVCSRCWFENIRYENGNFILEENATACIYVGS